MKISKPEKAIGAFEQALRKNPADARRERRVARRQGARHDARVREGDRVLLDGVPKGRVQAGACRGASNAPPRRRMGPPRARPCPAPQVLRHELAELYSELKKYDQAQAELSQLLDHLEGAADKSLDDMCQEVRSLVLLARVHRERGALQLSLIHI